MPFSFPFHSFAVSRFDDDAQGSTRLYINVNWVRKFLTKVFEINCLAGDDVFSNSWFCLVNWHLGKFGPRPGGG